MERDCERERVLLGYALRDPFAGSPRRRSSDVDFQDVFGGPPRRASFHGARRSHADSIDSHSRASWPRRARRTPRISHLGSSEKPVFGDGSWFSTDRRRQLGDDFFNDIFLSSDSARSSPRRGDLDPSLSSPNPNILSPKRSTSVRCVIYEHHASGEVQMLNLIAIYFQDVCSSAEFYLRLILPTFSVSVKMSDSFDYPSLGSPAYHSVFGIGDGGRDTSSSPSSPNAYSTAFAIRSSIGHGDIRNDEKQWRMIIHRLFANDVLFAKSDKKLQNDSNKHPEKGGEQIEDVLVQRTNKNSNANATYKKSSPDIMFYSHGEPHSEINSLTQLFVDDMDKSSSHNIPLKVKASEVPSEGQIKQIRKERVSIYAEVNNNSMHDSSHSLVDKTSGRSKVKGKVKEFIKKFNQDATPKQRGAFEMYDHRSTSNGGRRTILMSRHMPPVQR
ncbi:hypothetical protein HPP92_024904 [Vanilla planifolia]|uniref:Uncharacterized protein n=1 Tax=Vanilla planifolia TaxID=51239 RepID=A0A835PQ74_VANPL|nr:hypothetical protein HPP92_024904 [Vanilla planifolia]